MRWQDHIIVDPQILVGKPVVRGTRLSVELIIDLMGRGWSEAQLRQNYPGLGTDAIRACLLYAAEVLHDERGYPPLRDITHPPR